MFLIKTPAAFADGGYFIQSANEGQLAQTRQEALLAVHADDVGTDYVTYVLRTQYDGNPGEFAWVIPLPSTPTDVVSHENASLFDDLNEETEPRFFVAMSVGYGCVCGALDAGSISVPGLVEVEAGGRAGVFEWVALTSTGTDALLTWLNENGYTVPEDAEDILDAYIQDGMHFLALRVAEPDQVVTNGNIEIPPIQFTCQTDQRFYPMAISRISAAEETEVLIYILADHRAAAANVSNALLSQETVMYDRTTDTNNYASEFDRALASWDGVVFVTESAYSVSAEWLSSVWPQAPVLLTSTYLTRLRTIMTPDQMNLDLMFRDAASSRKVYPTFYRTWRSETSLSLAGPPLMLLALYGGLRTIVRRRRVR
jgi:hypothetical protein